MSGAKGSALEWALALLMAPGERHLLRQRPLPREDMGLLLSIAAGATPEVLEEQAHRFGESQARVVEAARFYAREVLFHPQASAYRMLGVEPAASAEEIKAHHRLLQLWLHPDRARNEDDAVFAARVNSAWNRLRSPERRQAYDQALRAERPPEIFDSSGALRSVRTTWVPAAEPMATPSPWRRRLPALALLALCGVLVLLALRDMDRADVTWEAGQTPPVPAGVADIEPFVPLILRPGAIADPGNQRVHPGPISTGVSGVLTDAPRSAALASGAGLQPRVDTMPASSMVNRRAFSEAHLAGTGSSAVVGAAASAAPAPHAGDASVPPAPVQPAVVTVAPAPAAAPIASAPQMEREFARVQSARSTGEQLLDYIGSPHSAVPPIWSSPGVEEAARRLRDRLHAQARTRLAAPRWRVGGDEAVLESTAARAGETVPNEQLTARLRWRDGYWLVTGVEMEPAR